MDRTLIILRHAKSSWETSAADFRRPLAERGVRDGVAAGRVLAEYSVDLVLCSGARRALQTWERAVAGGAGAGEVRVEDDIYYGGTRAVLGLLRGLDDAVATAVVIGHEPTLSDVVARLAAPSTLVDEATDRFPTSAIAVLRVPGAWSDLADGTAELVRFEVPRG